ncbi:hypothetical protein TRFO_03736 [Tritrichomonas foetus]|uniref:Uncharacterized protein n=1 Tax=Tritrichomonas foetus TaxID=1144522 RepID=A0A1J4KQP0_9EUKA|nr:hypothetical protein TRFO_03736 [Tritrichomonas foetus]|eukprot:OHT12108.1 hypothetical protein TRFO_03736 [Tritrichomonas foetus]
MTRPYVDVSRRRLSNDYTSEAVNITQINFINTTNPTARPIRPARINYSDDDDNNSKYLELSSDNKRLKDQLDQEKAKNYNLANEVQRLKSDIQRLKDENRSLNNLLTTNEQRNNARIEEIFRDGQNLEIKHNQYVFYLGKIIRTINPLYTPYGCNIEQHQNVNYNPLTIEECNNFVNMLPEMKRRCDGWDYLTSEVQSLSNELSTIKFQFNDKICRKSTKIKALKSDVKRLEDENQRLKIQTQNYSNYSQEISQLREELSNIQKNRDAYKSAYDDNLKDITQIARQFIPVQNPASGFSANEYQSFKKMVPTFVKQIREHSSLKSQLDQLREKNTILEKQRTGNYHYQDEIRQLKREIQTLQELQSETNKNVKNLSQEFIVKRELDRAIANLENNRICDNPFHVIFKNISFNILSQRKECILTLNENNVKIFLAKFLRLYQLIDEKVGFPSGDLNDCLF